MASSARHASMVARVHRIHAGSPQRRSQARRQRRDGKYADDPRVSLADRTDLQSKKEFDSAPRRDCQTLSLSEQSCEKSSLRCRHQ